MDDNTKKIMLFSSVLGSLAALTFGYKYYYEQPINIEDEPTKIEMVNTRQTTLPKGEQTKHRTSFLSSLTQSIGFGGDIKNDENTTKQEVASELQEHKKETDEKQWPTFN